MKINGIVCEYNPFHNGHSYHISETRKNGATHIIAVMSGNFVQRGDVAVLDKFTRAELAVKSGVDLVVELPVAYCLSSAEIFARGAVYLLDSLGVVDEISFGSECGNIDRLVFAMNKADEVAESKVMRELMGAGMTYPRALSTVLDVETAELIAEPNNILAVEYLKALKYFNSAIKPFTVKRAGASHDSMNISDGFASASYIRENIESADNFVPEIWADALKNDIALLKRLERLILYKVRTVSDEELSVVNDISGGLVQRIYGNNSASLENMLESVKTKCFTMARIKRVLLSMLIGITKNDATILPPYVRVLAFNEKGREILALTKKSKKIPIGTSLAKLGRLNADAQRYAEIESTATDIYSLAFENILQANTDYTRKIKETK
ncbi:MAG: nucleotidyltransferase family protein [Ruminococcus sp.]|nr:nucleotidyltransferase family protein [Ruminococcus sp.]